MTEPQDQLGSFEGRTIDALAKLTDAQLEEQVIYWRMMMDRSTGRSTWGYSKLLSVANRERERRATHTTDSLDEFAKLTEEDKDRLRQYQQGARFVGSARNKLVDFATEREWSDEVLNDVLALLVRTSA